jgi:hypothetical protein
MLGHVNLTTTELYTRLPINLLRQVYSATHPAARLKLPENPGNQGAGCRGRSGSVRRAGRALELGYSVGTANVRHFQLMPGLNVIQL